MKIINCCAIFLLLSIFSCKEDFFEQVVELDIPEHMPALAVSANFSDIDTNLVVFVSNSVGVLEPDQPAIVENATVELFKNNTLIHSLNYKANGLYGVAGVDPIGNFAAEYLLKVQAPGFEEITSIQQMPQAVAITEADYEIDGAITPDGDRANNISITFQDPGGLENYYSISALGRVSSGGFEYENMVYLSSFNPIVEEGEQFLVFSDATFDGKEVKLNFYTYDDLPQNIDSVELDISLISITKDRYFFEKSLNIFNNSDGNPFVEPVVVHSNIENGHGIFTLESRSVFTLKIL